MSRRTVWMIITLSLVGAAAWYLAGDGGFGPRLNEPEDGGPGAYTVAQSPAPAATEPASSEAPTVAAAALPAKAEDFPLGQAARIATMGGGFRGFGMLAQYEGSGPRRVYVKRRTASNSGEAYTPTALARVVDPDGNLVVCEDFSLQAPGTEARVLDVPAGKPGIWRVSFTGGRQGDEVEIRLPATNTWGVRGEMALGVSASTPRPAYLWVPPSAKKLFMAVESGPPAGIALRTADGSRELAAAKPLDIGKGRNGFSLEPAPAGDVCRLDLPEGFGGVIDFEGVPGLLCPSEEAARTLQGGTVESHGLRVAGPLQARARDWMVRHAEAVRQAPPLAWPKEVPADLARPDLEVLPFGKYGGLNGVGALTRAQDANMDPMQPYFGIPTPQGLPAGDPGSWVNFLPFSGRFLSITDAASLAALYQFDGRLNPAHGNPAMLDRACLAGFFHFEALQGDDLIRDGSILKVPYPCTHTFFIYESLAQALCSVGGNLAPEAREIWTQGLMAIGDKAADHQAYESNQWAHMLKGHLDTYVATGQRRFLDYFERGIAAYFAGAYGPASKFGQHPAGYFLEEYGPDGNYDRLNLYAVVASYNTYRDLPDRNPGLVKAMREGIARNLRFKSFFWLPQPNGNLHSPTGLNCRTSGKFCFNGYPGEYLAREEFPLGAARYYLDRPPAEGIGVAGITSFVANTPEWIARTLRQGVAWGPDQFSGGGAWVPALAQAYGSGKIAEPAPLPYAEAGGNWQLPGMAAWNRGGIYGVVFADVEGANRPLAGHMGGGPTVLWTSAVGSFVASMQPVGDGGHLHADATTISKPEQLTFSCVYGTTDRDAFFASGRERAALSTTADNGTTVTSKMGSPALASFTWTYLPTDSGLELSVSLKTLGELKESFLNLPMRTASPDVHLKLEQPNRLVCAGPKGSVTITWQADHPGRLERSALASIQRLVIPLAAGAEPLTLTLNATP